MPQDNPPVSSSRRLPFAATAAIAALLAFLIVPRVILHHTHTLLITPVDHDALAWIIVTGIMLSQAIFWALFGRTVLTGWNKAAVFSLTFVGFLFAVPFAMAAALLSSEIYGAYTFHGAAVRSREMLYVVEDVSSSGRGGPHASVNPYGLGRISLPLSQAQYTRYFAPLPAGQLFGYPLIEQRQGNAIRIIEPEPWMGPARGLILCTRNGPRVVMNTSDICKH